MPIGTKPRAKRGPNPINKVLQAGTATGARAPRRRRTAGARSRPKRVSRERGTRNPETHGRRAAAWRGRGQRARRGVDLLKCSAVVGTRRRTTRREKDEYRPNTHVGCERILKAPLNSNSHKPGLTDTGSCMN